MESSIAATVEEQVMSTRTKKTAREYAGEIKRLKTDIRYLEEQLNRRGVAQFCLGIAVAESVWGEEILHRTHEISLQVMSYTRDELVAYWNEHRELPPRMRWQAGRPTSEAAD
jgi:hypothetical protein